MTDHAAHAAGAAGADDAAPAAADRQDMVQPALSRAPHATETRRLYAADWAAFAAWCRTAGLGALPAAPATVAAYLRSLSATLRPGALARRAAAIADRHRRNSYPSPGTDPAVRAVFRAARRTRDVACKAGTDTLDALSPSPPPPSRRRALPGPAQLARMAARCPGDLAGLRDRALLLLAAARLDPERLLALDHEHVRFTAAGAELAGSGVGEGEGVALSRMASPACPVRALEDWLRSSDTRFGPVFRKVDRWGNVEHRRLRPDALRRIWRRRAVARRPRRLATRTRS